MFLINSRSHLFSATLQGLRSKSLTLEGIPDRIRSLAVATAKAIIFGIFVGTIGVFSYIQLGVSPKIMWAGPNAIIGGLLFGFGIVLAGGCETGWMYRSMEGQVHFMWVGVGNVIGSTYLAYVWDDIAPVLALDYDKLNLLKEFGPVGGLLVNYGLLIACLVAVVWWEKRFLAKAKAKVAAASCGCN